jgi:hypothetical protein
MVDRRYILIGVEGNHDQAFISKILTKLFNFKKFGGKRSDLDPFWRKFIPVYPKSGDLYKRLDMPTILERDDSSVAIYVGEGSNLAKNLNIKLSDLKRTDLFAFAIIADADKKSPIKVAQGYQDELKESFPHFPDKPGLISSGKTRLGIYIFPDNTKKGVLENLLCQCGEVAYSDCMKKATDYIDYFKGKPIMAKWKPFDYEKAKVATIVSILKPGKTNTSSIADNDWVSHTTLLSVPDLQKLNTFLENLLC